MHTAISAASLEPAVANQTETIAPPSFRPLLIPSPPVGEGEVEGVRLAALARIGSLLAWIPVRTGMTKKIPDREDCRRMPYRTGVRLDTFAAGVAGWLRLN